MWRRGGRLAHGFYGNYVDALGDAHGFEQTAGGVFTTLDDPARVGSTFFNVSNDRGDLVGAWQDCDGHYHPFYVSGGSFHDLSLPFLDAEPWGINDKGQIVGFYRTSDTGPYQGFMTQVPEPGTWTMLLVGVGLIGVLLRRRRVHPLCDDRRRPQRDADVDRRAPAYGSHSERRPCSSGSAASPR